MKNKKHFIFPDEIIQNIGESLRIDKQAKSPTGSVIKTAIRKFQRFYITLCLSLKSQLINLITITLTINSLKYLSITILRIDKPKS